MIQAQFTLHKAKLQRSNPSVQAESMLECLKFWSLSLVNPVEWLVEEPAHLFHGFRDRESLPLCGTKAVDQSMDIALVSHIPPQRYDVHLLTFSTRQIPFLIMVQMNSIHRLYLRRLLSLFVCSLPRQARLACNNETNLEGVGKSKH